MNKDKIKLIVSDIDGTLINDQDEISKDFKDMIDHLKKHDIIFAAASGRGVYSIKNKLDYDDAKNIYILSDNGAIIMYQDEVIDTNHFTSDSYQSIISALNTLDDITIAAATPYDTFVSTSNPDINDKFLFEFYNKYTQVDNLLEINEDIVGVNIHCKQGSSHILSKDVVKALSGDFDIIQSGDNWIDILPSNSNKGLAVEKLCNILDIKLDNVIAFGDYNNDIEMLEMVGRGYAMEDATDDLKKVADEVIGSNNDFSVVKKVYELLDL